MTLIAQRLLHEPLLFTATLADSARKIAVVDEGTAYSYAQLREASQRLACDLQARGVRGGDRIAIYMDNTWPCVVSIYATLMAGAAFMIINPQTKADKLAFILRDSGARLLISDGHLAGVFLPVLEEAEDLQEVICSGELPTAKEAAKPITAFDAAIASAPAMQPPPVIPLDLAALIYTSGSTGTPKGVMQTHQSMVFAAGSLIQYLRLASSDRILCVLPLAFDYGLYQLLMAVTLGATLILERSFIYPAQVFERMREHSVTVFPGVPTIYSLLLSAHGRSPLHFPSVTRLTNTAAALPDDFIRRLREVFPQALIYKMYGLTECKRVCYLEPELIDAKPGSVGKAIPGTEVYLLTAQGKPVPAGEAGILHVRGPHVMLGYWNRPDLTDQMLRPGKYAGERVLCTHDQFRMDEQGFLYFVGRTDDIIKTRGEKVSPVEVENALHSIPGVSECAVVGVPDEIMGQAIRAYIVLETGAQLVEKQVRALSAARLENFMVPREIIFCSSLPKTATGKVSKRLLLEQGPR